MLAAVDTVVFWLLLFYAMLVAIDLVVQAIRGGRGLGLVLPNWLALAVILAVVAKLAILQPPAAVVVQHLAIGIVGMAVTFFLFMKGSLGGGVAKLLPLVLAFLGPAYLLESVALFFVIIALGAIPAILMNRAARSETRG
jgi:Flp pilus assembly protein protease CpaA